MAGEFLVNGRHPESVALSQFLAQLVHRVAAGHRAHHVDVRGFSAFLLEFFQGRFHGRARGQHGICHDKGFPFQGRAGAIVCEYLEIISLTVLAESGQEGTLGMVEHLQETALQGQARPQDGANHQGRVKSGDRCDSQGRLNLFLRIA